MGISYSELSKDSALTVISKFIIVKESFDLFQNYCRDSPNAQENRTKNIMRLLVAGLVLDVSRKVFMNQNTGQNSLNIVNT